MQEVRRTVEQLAPINVPVLIQGAKGTGKEVIAQEIHLRSPWHGGPFVKTECSTLQGTQLTNELFGYVEGADDRNWDSRGSLVDQANAGTLFLDEISAMDLATQTRLLCLFEDDRLNLSGDGPDGQFGFRIVCSTRCPLEAETALGKFRADLFYRINVTRIQLPGIRERREDLADLLEYFLEVYSGQYCRCPRPFSSELLDLFYEYEWPGNVRELESYIQRYVQSECEREIIGELSNRRAKAQSAGMR
jgi:DNA-binding NtrC family response regulator